MRTRHTVWLRGSVIALGLAIGGIFVSFMPLLALSVIDVDWSRLSSIGQSFTAGATLISSFALVGVVASLRLQVRQFEIQQGQTIRQFQFDLLQLAMSDPLYASVVPVPLEAPNRDEYRRFVYITQWIRYWEFIYIAGETSSSSAEDELVELFKIPDNRIWWDLARPTWTSGTVHMDEQRREFVRIIERAHSRSSLPTPS
jgi:hypothetical protein